MKPRFDISSLRRRVKIHDMYAEGFSTMEISNHLSIDVRDVQRYLKRSRPNLKEQIPPWWTENAACKEEDIDLFFPPMSGPGAVAAKREAKKICAGCPVRQRCYDTAAANYEHYGVWGGVDFSKYSYIYDELTGNVTVIVKGGHDGEVTQVG